jgi:hypothetical protein
MWRINTQQESANYENVADMASIRASCWRKMVNSAHHVFSEELPGLNNNPAEFKRYLKSNQSSRWLPAVAEGSRQKRRNRIILQPGTFLEIHGDIAQTLPFKEASHKRREADFGTGKTLDLFNEGFENESLSSVKTNWLAKALNKPGLVAGVIGFCLLTASIYAGLGYWWITSTGFSHAAEPDSSMASPGNGPDKAKSRPHFLENIETLQNENKLIIPKDSVQIDEKLIAQGSPVKTFTMDELRNPVTEPTGRPDPFSPLIQEKESEVNAPVEPEEKRDILEDVEYTGFIGDVNSKNILAIIRLADPASGGFKTLIKKTGEFFYVDEERIYLKAITKSSLTLRAEGVNRNLELNPYQESVFVNKGGGSDSRAKPSKAIPNPSLQDDLDR